LKLHTRVARIEKILGHTFSDKHLVELAITHPSAVEGHRTASSYERLEFLGDSVVGAIVAFDLYERFPDMNEGELTRMKISLVSGATLSAVAGELGVGELIVFGDSERGSGARGLRSALEDVYEALVGALYLDAGYEPTQAFVSRTLGPKITPELARKPESPKSELQEIVQRDHHCDLVYKLEQIKGPAHAPTFVSVVLVGGRRLGRGVGGSKKESEAAAAREAIAALTGGTGAQAQAAAVAAAGEGASTKAHEAGDTSSAAASDGGA
jgi:ribonuclease-3